LSRVAAAAAAPGNGGTTATPQRSRGIIAVAYNPYFADDGMQGVENDRLREKLFTAVDGSNTTNNNNNYIVGKVYLQFGTDLTRLQRGLEYIPINRHCHQRYGGGKEDWGGNRRIDLFAHRESHRAAEVQALERRVPERRVPVRPRRGDGDRRRHRARVQRVPRRNTVGGPGDQGREGHVIVVWDLLRRASAVAIPATTAVAAGIAPPGQELAVDDEGDVSQLQAKKEVASKRRRVGTD